MNKYYGLYRGKVCNINDPEKRGRIKCIIPEVLGEDTESAWCEPNVEVAYDNGGDWCLPQDKETIYLMFEAGDPNKPVYFGNWWSKNKTPLGNNYDSLKSKVRIINFADCTIMMSDGKMELSVGDGTTEVKIENGKVTINGDLTTSGDITCRDINCRNITASGSISASGSVSAPNIH